MDLEQPVELQRLPIAHQLAPAEDDDVVGDEDGGRSREGRERRLARHEAEVLRLVALDCLEDALEERPELQAEWSIEGGNAELEQVFLRHGVVSALECRDWGIARIGGVALGLSRF